MTNPKLTRTVFLGPIEKRPSELPPIPDTPQERLALLCKVVLGQSHAEAKALAAKMQEPRPRGSTEIRGWFDGSCRPINPGGHGGAGAIVKRNGVTIFSTSRYLGSGPMMSNNVSEFAAAICALRFLLSENIREATLYGDSSLVVGLLNGRLKAKRGLYLEHYREAFALRERLPGVRLVLIPRGQNLEADALATAATRGR